MDPALKALIATLSIRDQVDSVLKKIDNRDEKGPLLDGAAFVGR